jgi:hypothetical protein
MHALPKARPTERNQPDRHVGRKPEVRGRRDRTLTLMQKQTFGQPNPVESGVTDTESEERSFAAICFDVRNTRHFRDGN